MSGVQIALLGLTVALQLACAVAVLSLRSAFDRLHLVGAASVFATVPLVAAAVLGASSRTHLAKVVATGLVLWLSSPFVTRATARALRIRSTGRLEVADDEVEAR